MKLYKNMKAIVDGNTKFFDSVAEDLQRDALVQSMFIICQFNVLRSLIDLIKENGFTFKKARRRYPADTIKDADYTDDLAL